MSATDVTATGVDAAVVDMMDAVFADYRNTHPPTEGRVAGDPTLWQVLDDVGLVRLTAAEAAGGSGAGWYEAVELHSAAARHAVRTPLAEHDLLACWLLDAAGLPCDGAVRTVALLDDEGTARGVPWAGDAERIVLVWSHQGQYQVLDTEPHSVRIALDTNAIGEPRDLVMAELNTLRGVPACADLVAQIRRKSALVRSVQLCAALDRILALSIEHTTTRTQFGRPLAKFQTVQNLISDIAAEAALARAATETALTAAVTSDWSGTNLDFLVAVARSCAGHATSVVVRNAHQVHGAIGTTREHRLHEFTRAALAWRGEFGSVQHWDDVVTDAALHAGAAGLWGLVTGERCSTDRTSVLQRATPSS